MGNLEIFEYALLAALVLAYVSIRRRRARHW